MQIRWITFLILGVIFLPSCTKEPKNQHPVVTFIRPSGDSPQFSSISDTVIFRVSDDKLVHSVSISFVNEDLISLTQPITLNIYSKDTVIDHIIELGSIEVEKGFILIRADDESQTKLKYQPVVLRDKPLSAEQIVTAYRENYQTVIALFDPLTGQIISEQRLDYEMESIEGNAKSNLILLWPMSNRFVEIRAVKTAETIWRVEAAFPQAEYVDYFLHDDKLLLADRNGNLKLHHFHTGNVQLAAQVEVSKIILAVCFDQQYLYAAAQDLQTGKYWLQLYFRASGVFYKRFEILFDARDLLPASDSSGVFLFASKESGSTQIYHFNREAEVIELESAISDFEFIPPAASQKEFIFLRNATQIRSLSTIDFVSQAIANGMEINGMAISPSNIDWVYYIDQSFIHYTNSGNLGGVNTGTKLDLITLIKE